VGEVTNTHKFEWEKNEGKNLLGRFRRSGERIGASYVTFIFR